MKAKFLIGLVLMLVGTNLFTYATTHYWTTSYVLPRALSGTYSALRQAGHYDLIYPPETNSTEQKPNSSVFMAINMAGGMYYWWNDGILYWIAGGLLTVSGVLVPFVQSRQRATA